MPEMTCSKCGAFRDDQEIITNFGICDACFDALPCPCDEGRPHDCPQHGPEGR